MTQRRSIHLILIALIGAAIYSNTLHNPFIFDDELYIVNNPKIHDLANMLDFAGTRYFGMLSFALNYSASGTDTFAYHITNIIIHIINSILVYMIIALLLPCAFGHSQAGSKNADATKKPARWSAMALATALLFLTHPIQTQSVAYIAQRITSLATLFYLATILLYILMRSAKGEGLRSRGVGFYLLYFLSIVSCVAAQKSKEIAFTLPFILLLIEFSFPLQGERSLKRLFYALPFFLTLFIIPMTLFISTHDSWGSLVGFSENVRLQQLTDLSELSSYSYLLTEFRVIVTYIRLLIAPISQTLIYRFPLLTTFSDPRVFISFFFLAAILSANTFFFIRSIKTGNIGVRIICFGIYWFFITLSVESSVIPINDVINEHRLYLPSFGPFLSVTAAIFMIKERLSSSTASRLGRIPIVLLFIVSTTLILSISTYKRNQVWSDTVIFWNDGVEKNPQSYKVQNNLANAYQSRGNLNMASRHYREAIKINPSDETALYNLAQNLLHMGEVHGAIEYYTKAAVLAPKNPQIQNNLGNAYLEAGNTSSALASYREAIRIAPLYYLPHHSLARLYERMGDFRAAQRELETTLRLNPNTPFARSELERVKMLTNRLG